MTNGALSGAVSVNSSITPSGSLCEATCTVVVSIVISS